MKLVKSLFGPKTRGRSISFALVIVAYIVISILQSAGSIPRMISSLLVPVCCYIVAAIGLNMNVGISGELNLGQAGFMSVGGFRLSGSFGFSTTDGFLGISGSIIFFT